jgi:hypothetical protein
MQIFGNEIKPSAVKKALRNRDKYVKKFGFDPEARYPLSAERNETVGELLGIQNLVIGTHGAPIKTARSLVIGTIRMGYGHYRPAMAIASAARHLGITPYWLDILAYEETTGAKIVHHIEKLYSLGSRLSQKSRLFNRFYWEPLMAEGMKKLDINADFKYMCELMAPVFSEIPDSVPIVGTHAWAALAALSAGKRRVVNMIPDNWPLGLHLTEGALHCIQTPSVYMGYRTLKNMAVKGVPLNPIPADDIAWVGHNIDHELVANIEKDCRVRLARMKSGKPRRLLISIGGAGAQGGLVAKIIEWLAPMVKAGKAILYINTGDHRDVFDTLSTGISKLGIGCITHTEWPKIRSFAAGALKNDAAGIHLFHSNDIFAAVYATNLLMRSSDILITKPSELAYYPVPKLLIQRVGGHEAWGAIRSSEVGDGTLECETPELALQALDLLVNHDDLFTIYCESIVRQKKIGTYGGAYNVVKLAMKR